MGERQSRSVAAKSTADGQYHSAIETRTAGREGVYMTQVKKYLTRLEADLATIVLRAEGILATAVGEGVATEGRIEEVRVLVPEDQLEAARTVLGDT